MEQIKQIQKEKIPLLKKMDYLIDRMVDSAIKKEENYIIKELSKLQELDLDNF